MHEYNYNIARTLITVTMDAALSARMSNQWMYIHAKEDERYSDIVSYIVSENACETDYTLICSVTPHGNVIF